MLEGVCAEFCLDNRLTLSSLTVLFRRWIGPSHPLCEKLPRRISESDGASASALPVASHMPNGGLDSKNLREALRKRL